METLILSEINTKVPKDLIFISAQPDELYFHWQVALYLYNFTKKGIPKEQCFAIFAIKDKASDFIVNLKKTYPGIYWYSDTRSESVDYISSVRPHILTQFFSQFPELGKNIFYHDSDILFHKIPPFEQMLDDDICYLSDTVNYIGYNYISDCCKRYEEIYPELGETDILDKMAECANVSVDIIKANQESSGGAQYLLKGINADYWDEVEKDSINLYKLLLDYTTQNPIKKHIQKWTADMWAVLWNIWKREKVTALHDELSFSWATHACDESKNSYFSHNIFHLAGVTNEFSKSHPDFFNKTRYRHINIIELLREDIHALDFVNIHNATGKYIENAIDYVCENYAMTYVVDKKLRALQAKEMLIIKGVICNTFDLSHKGKKASYTKSSQGMCGKSIWKGLSNDKIIFYNGRGWLVTGVKYIDDLNKDSGGYFFSLASDKEPYEAKWEDDVVVDFVANEFLFKNSQVDDTYVKTDSFVNEKAIWETKSNKKIMFYNKYFWVIVDEKNKSELSSYHETEDDISSYYTDKEPYDAVWYV